MSQMNFYYEYAAVEEKAENSTAVKITERMISLEKADKFFSATLKRLLNERLSEAEEQSLKDEGFNFKAPKRKAAVMVALYKKAALGDLSAIKQLTAVLGSGEQSDGAVRIIDNVGD